MEKDPDAVLVATFKMYAQPNEAKSIAEGRLVCDDIELCEIRAPGSRDVKAFPAHTRSHWAVDPYTGLNIEVSYAQRFRRQYEQFKAHAQQTKTGTPLQYVPFLTEARRAELRALNIYTVEALAEVEGAELKNLGYQGRDLKNRAIEYIADRKVAAPEMQLRAEVEALRAQNQVLRETDNLSKYAEMTNQDLCKQIEDLTGQAPKGNSERKTLIRILIDAEAARQRQSITAA